MDSGNAAGGDAKKADGYILAIDQGTTSSRVLVIDHDLKVIGSASREHA
jgi:glycerol kinase